MFYKNLLSSDHVNMVHWITQDAPVSSNEEIINTRVGVSHFDFDDVENLEPEEDFDWV